MTRYLETTCCLTEDGWVELLDGRMVRGHWAGHGKQPSHLLLHTTASQHAVTPDPPTRHNISKIRYTLHTTLLYLHCAILYYYTLILSYLILLKGNFKGLGTIIFCNRYPYSINLLLKRWHTSKISKKGTWTNIKRTSLLILGTTRFNILYLWKCHISFTEETDYVATNNTNVICCLSVNVEARSEEVKTFSWKWIKWVWDLFQKVFNNLKILWNSLSFVQKV